MRLLIASVILLGVAAAHDECHGVPWDSDGAGTYHVELTSTTTCYLNGGQGTVTCVGS